MNANLQGWLGSQIQDLKDQHLYKIPKILESPAGGRVHMNGKEVVNLSSNNYLGLANHPKVKEAALEAIKRWGVGAGAVRWIGGTMSVHKELEDRLASFKHTEAVLVFTSGFTANSGCIPAVTTDKDVIISDELNHASIIDGCRLSKAKVVRYAHNSVEDLRKKILEHKDSARRMLVITDGVFSMDGDIAPIPEIVKVADEFGVMVMVDDAHGEGVLGDSGRGIVDHFNLQGKVEIEVGTLSKAFGVMGGFITGPKILIDYLKQKGRPFLFSTGLTPADTAAAMAAVDVLMGSDELVRKLWDNAAYFQKGLKEAGFDIGKTQTPITPVMLGDEGTAVKFSKRLFEKGIFAQSIVFPTVAKGKARIRCMLSASHEKEDLDFALKTFTEVAKEMGVF